MRVPYSWAPRMATNRVDDVPWFRRNMGDPFIRNLLSPRTPSNVMQAGSASSPSWGTNYIPMQTPGMMQGSDPSRPVNGGNMVQNYIRNLWGFGQPQQQTSAPTPVNRGPGFSGISANVASLQANTAGRGTAPKSGGMTNMAQMPKVPGPSNPVQPWGTSIRATQPTSWKDQYHSSPVWGRL